MEKAIPSLTVPEQRWDSNPGLPLSGLELSPLAQSSSDAPIPALCRQGSLSQHIPRPTWNRQLWPWSHFAFRALSINLHEERKTLSPNLSAVKRSSTVPLQTRTLPPLSPQSLGTQEDMIKGSEKSCSEHTR